jgi:hypothetical protein
MSERSSNPTFFVQNSSASSWSWTHTCAFAISIVAIVFSVSSGLVAAS